MYGVGVFCIYEFYSDLQNQIDHLLICILFNFSLQYDVDNEKIELRKTKNQIDYQRNEKN
ncbi:hypothetical protein DERP_014336 [Dermatophagoides pteronyssinus]|uniref:Uncharacterized protein n=1 Tax=Dermatophagoides pteronyssinus TaxID=6956 RepID=A0ABQ8JY30_DERPT|nr:hypothetical protein DERP_014336 [Dermatophagoides pteronyssinus]